MGTLAVQLAVIAVVIVACVLLLRCFPYPSPLIRPLLSARLRWPERQIRGWLETGEFRRAYLAYFYRDPERWPDAESGIIAPADGIITSADVRDGVRYIVIALSFWDMHIQRSPLDGTVVSVEPYGDVRMDGEGREFVFLREKHCPVQQRIVLDTAAGLLAVRLITSVAARRIEVWVKPGETVARGQRIGKILLGSTVVLEVPERYSPTVQKGSRVWAGQTILVSLPSCELGA